MIDSKDGNDMSAVKLLDTFCDTISSATIYGLVCFLAGAAVFWAFLFIFCDKSPRKYCCSLCARPILRGQKYTKWGCGEQIICLSCEQEMAKKTSKLA